MRCCYGSNGMTQERRLVGHVVLVPELGDEAVISMDLIKIIAKEGISNFYLYSMLRFSGIAENISQHANGTNVLHLKPDLIGRVGTILPDSKVIGAFEKQVLPIYEKIESLENQNVILAEGRDRLLPRLMSGEIEV